MPNGPGQALISSSAFGPREIEKVRWYWSQGEQMIVVTRAIALLLMLGISGLATGSLAQNQNEDERAMTGRDYFNELKQSDGLPKWAANVCFARVFEDPFGKFFDATASNEFLLIGDDGPGMKFQLYTRGVGGNAFVLTREFRDDNSSRFAGRMTVDGQPTAVRFGINWNTGRFLRSEEKGMTSGVCQAIE